MKNQVKSTNISIRKEDDGSFSVNGGYATQDYDISTNGGTIKVPKSVAEVIIDLYNKIFGTHITLGD